MVEFRVLKCSDCQTFQVLQVTKSQKWKCKLCGSKQSVIKVYGCGTGADCRKHVQKLNSLRGEMDSFKEEVLSQAPVSMPPLTKDTSNYEKGDPATSQWTKFMPSQPDDVSDEDDNNVMAQGLCVTTDRAMFETEHKQARNNKKRLASRDDSTRYSPHHPSSVKRSKEPNEWQRHTFVSASVSSRQGSMPAGPSHRFQFKQGPCQNSPLHAFNIVQQSEPTKSFVTRTEQGRGHGMMKPFSTVSEVVPCRGEVASVEIQNRAPKSYHNASHSDPMSDPMEPTTGNISRNNMSMLMSTSKCVSVENKSTKGLNVSAKPSKWASFLDNDHDENVNSDEDSDLLLDECGQLTVCLPSSNGF